MFSVWIGILRKVKKLRVFFRIIRICAGRRHDAVSNGTLKAELSLNGKTFGCLLKA